MDNQEYFEFTVEKKLEEVFNDIRAGKSNEAKTTLSGLFNPQTLADHLAKTGGYTVSFDGESNEFLFEEKTKTSLLFKKKQKITKVPAIDIFRYILKCLETDLNRNRNAYTEENKGNATIYELQRFGIIERDKVLTPEQRSVLYKNAFDSFIEISQVLYPDPDKKKVVTLEDIEKYDDIAFRAKFGPENRHLTETTRENYRNNDTVENERVFNALKFFPSAIKKYMELKGDQPLNLKEADKLSRYLNRYNYNPRSIYRSYDNITTWYISSEKKKVLFSECFETLLSLYSKFVSDAIANNTLYKEEDEKFTEIIDRLRKAIVGNIKHAHRVIDEIDDEIKTKGEIAQSLKLLEEAFDTLSEISKITDKNLNPKQLTVARNHDAWCLEQRLFLDLEIHDDRKKLQYIKEFIERKTAIPTDFFDKDDTAIIVKYFEEFFYRREYSITYDLSSFTFICPENIKGGSKQDYSDFFNQYASIGGLMIGSINIDELAADKINEIIEAALKTTTAKRYDNQFPQPYFNNVSYVASMNKYYVFINNLFSKLEEALKNPEYKKNASEIRKIYSILKKCQDLKFVEQLDGIQWIDAITAIPEKITEAIKQIEVIETEKESVATSKEITSQEKSVISSSNSAKLNKQEEQKQDKFSFIIAKIFSFFHKIKEKIKPTKVATENENTNTGEISGLVSSFVQTEKDTTQKEEENTTEEIRKSRLSSRSLSIH